MAARFKLDILISALDRVTAPMRAINNRIQRITAGAQRFVTTMRSVGAAVGLTHITDQLRNVGSALGNVVARARTVVTSLGLLGAGVGFIFKRQFIDTAALFERYEVMLEALEGTSEKAKQSMGWISDFATRTPLELQDVVDAFVQLRTFGLDPTNGTMRALVDMNAKMGGSAEKLRGIIMAVGQAWTKQQLQGEEIMQLLERGVPVWDLLAKATGRNVKELQELSSKGKLGRQTIAALIEEIGRFAEGAADKQAKTWDGMISNILDAWTRFKKMVMDAGVFDFLKARLQGLLDTIDQMAASGRLEAMAKEWADAILGFLKAVETYLPQIWTEFKGFVGDVRAVLKPLIDRFGGLKVALGAIAAVVFGPLAAALATLAGSLIMLGVTILATPIGWFLAGIAAIAGAAYLIINNWEEVKEFLTGLWVEVQVAWQQAMELVGGLIDQVIGWADRILTSGWTRVKDFFAGIWKGVKDDFASVISWVANKVDWLLSIPEKISNVGSSIRSFFSSSGDSAAARPSTGAGSIASQVLPGAGSRARTDVKVQFENTPKGTRVQADTTGDAELDMSVGYSMQEAIP